ncbi:MAG: TonB family protein [Pyrinomonadaceae bacterium]
MFERQIGYDLDGNKQRGRSPYFGFSVGLVSLLFATFLVASIFADDFSLSGEGLEMSAMLSPAAVEPTVAEPERPQTPAAHSAASSVPTRTALVSPVDEPSLVPDKIGVTASKIPPMPKGPVIISSINDDGPRGNVGRPNGNEGGTAPQAFGPKEDPKPKVDDTAHDTPPPKAIDRTPRNLGIVNSKATYLPKPQYPETALRMGISGSVTVQVLIDEEGRVVSATASNGNELFRESALRAAKQAKFTPTKLSNVPIKVTGIIVYHFTR